MQRLEEGEGVPQWEGAVERTTKSIMTTVLKGTEGSTPDGALVILKGWHGFGVGVQGLSHGSIGVYYGEGHGKREEMRRGWREPEGH